MLFFSRVAISPIAFAPRSLRMTFATQRQRQSGLFEPPHAEIDNQLEALLLIRELTFVDDQPCIEFACLNSIKDLIKGHHHRFEVAGHVQLERKRRRRQCAGNRDPFADQIVGRVLLARNHHRTISVTHAGTRWQQRVLVGQLRISMDADGRDLKFALQSPAVERFDVFQLMPKLVWTVSILSKVSA